MQYIYLSNVENCYVKCETIIHLSNGFRPLRSSNMTTPKL